MVWTSTPSASHGRRALLSHCIFHGIGEVSRSSRHRCRQYATYFASCAALTAFSLAIHSGASVSTIICSPVITLLRLNSFGSVPYSKEWSIDHDALLSRIITTILIARQGSLAI
jgi:hypothetical protein